MADATITVFPEVTSPATTDILPIVTTPGTSPTDKKVQMGNLNVGLLGGYPANATPTANNIPVLDSALAMIGPGVARQVIINGGFTVNQRVYVSAATLAAGIYGHDRWKAGSGLISSSGSKFQLLRSREVER